jgi:hypothetical protein
VIRPRQLNSPFNFDILEAVGNETMAKILKARLEALRLCRSPPLLYSYAVTASNISAVPRKLAWQV